MLAHLRTLWDVDDLCYGPHKSSIYPHQLLVVNLVSFVQHNPHLQSFSYMTLIMHIYRFQTDLRISESTTTPVRGVAMAS